MAKNKKRILLGVTGSIAAYKSAEIIRRLQDEGCCVVVAMTKEAKEFITPLTFQTLSQNKVYSDMFEQDFVWEIEHISLAGSSDLVLIAPATANIIAKITYGICDDLLSSVVLATRAPILIAPAMDEGMYTNKITQENIKKLKSLGMKFIEPIKGKLASGKIGVGHLAEVEDIVKAVKKVL